MTQQKSGLQILYDLLENAPQIGPERRDAPDRLADAPNYVFNEKHPHDLDSFPYFSLTRWLLAVCVGLAAGFLTTLFVTLFSCLA